MSFNKCSWTIRCSYIEKECVSLANAGYDVTLIVADNKEDEIYRGVKIISIDFHPKNRLDRILNSKKKMLKKH